MQQLISLARLIRSWLPQDTAEPEAFTFIRHGDQSGGELFFDELMADERGNRHQVFVARH